MRDSTYRLLQLGVWLLVAAAAAATSGPGPVRVAVEFADGAARGPIAAQLEIVPEQAATEADRPEPRTALLQAPGEVELGLERAGVWRVRAQAKGFWVFRRICG